MSDPGDDTRNTSLLAQSRERLSAFFKQSSVKKLVSVLVPSALAAALFPVFGPVVARAAAAVAIKNSLSLLKIDMSTETIEKLLKPLEGQELSAAGGAIGHRVAAEDESSIENVKMDSEIS